ncbi:hypothetical protein HPE56_15885 [Maribacter sp. ANRC-HE7]|uniref:Uncharacterized protein n=1 Tax=Maribacter aquimaris TaxID=2737171 RepID=A0ABR7V6J5_9FLAO|nr:hypothetical protein [Maribacter aquimaris]MBD0779281.1 hypothetical protein [Maribacter aquimaris]
MKRLLIATVIILLLFSCKENARKNTDVNTNNTVPQSMNKEKKANTRKTAIVNVEADISGKKFSLTEYNPEASTDVVFLNGGLQFRIHDYQNKSVLVNLYSPEIFAKLPITITQQSLALPPKEAATSKTQSRIEILIPSPQHFQGDNKILYEGSVTLEELSTTKILINFDGKGIAHGARKKTENLFPMKGRIKLENFSIYDTRMKE